MNAALDQALLDIFSFNFNFFGRFVGLTYFVHFDSKSFHVFYTFRSPRVCSFLSVVSFDRFKCFVYFE